MLELSALRTAVAVLDHRSFRKAAKALDLPQSAISKRISALEDSLGTSLFHRETGGAQPTIAGGIFIEHARRLLVDLKEAVQDFQNAGEGRIGTLKIGCQISLTSGSLRETIIDFKNDHPELEVLLSEAQQSRLMGDLNNHSIDLLILVASPTDIVGESMALWTDPIVVALNAGHRLAALQVVESSDLKEERILAPRRDTSLDIHDHILARVFPMGWQPKLVRHETSRETIITLCGLGWGVTLLCEAASGAIYPNVVFKPVVRDGIPIMQEFVACWRERNDNPALRRFLSRLRARAA